MLIDTGWLRVLNGQTTQLTIPDGRLVSGRIRWRGVALDTIETVTTSDEASGSRGAGSVGTGTLGASAPAGVGWALTRVRATTSVYPDSPDFWWAFAKAPDFSDGVLNTGTGSSGSATQNNYGPGATGTTHNCGSDSSFSWTWRCTAWWSRAVTLQSVDPAVTVAGQHTGHSGTVTDGTVTDWYNLAGLSAGQVNSILHSIGGSGRVDVQIEVEYVPALTILQLEPDLYGRATRETLQFRVSAPAPSGSVATVWFPRIEAGMSADLSSPDYVWDASANQEGWSYFDGGSWLSIPPEGAPTNSECRFLPPADDMAIAKWFWRASAWDDDTEVWGAWSTVRQFRLFLSLASRYALEIGGADYSTAASGLTVSETSNGELGSMSFVLLVRSASPLPEDGDPVSLAVRDAAGSQDQFEGWQQGAPERVGPELYACYVKLPDAILAERYILKDYASQDVGQTVADIIDEYCAPLDSSEVDTATGFERPINAVGRTALDVLQELREQYGLIFWVRSTDLMVFLIKPEDLGVPVLTISRGQVA